VLGLIAWGLVYPFLPALTDPFWLSGLTLVWLLLVAATALRLARVSRPALLLVLPSFLWVALAAIPGYVLLTNGWSPGFAVTVGALDGTGGD
jgi:tryptophan-rich sensory protein